MSKFWGFRSLCRTFLLWQYASPRRIWNRKIYNTCADAHTHTHTHADTHTKRFEHHSYSNTGFS